MFGLIFGCCHWKGQYGCLSPSWPEAEVSTIFFKISVYVLKNPRRSPTHEMDPRGAQEGHIYVKTVSGSEEPLPDTYRRPEEIERRRGLWWLVPRLSLEWCSFIRELTWDWNRAENPRNLCLGTVPVRTSCLSFHINFIYRSGVYLGCFSSLGDAAIRFSQLQALQF